MIVNAGNPIKGLTKKQVEQIFTGEVTDWSAVGGSSGKISIYTRNTSSGTYSDFKELAMKKRDYAGGSQKMAGNEQIAAEVGKNANGIGYVGLAYDQGAAASRSCRSTASCLPCRPSTPRPIPTRVRPSTTPMANPSGLAKAIPRFHDRPAGQKIAAQVGFVPIK